MPQCRPMQELAESSSERDQLVTMTRSSPMPHVLMQRAQIVLMAAGRCSNPVIADALDVSRLSVGLRRRRFVAQRVPGLYDGLHPGGPRAIGDEQVAALVRKPVKKQPEDGTHRSCRSIAAETQLPRSTIHRVWKAFGPQPHRQKHFKLPTESILVGRCAISSGFI